VTEINLGTTDDGRTVSARLGDVLTVRLDEVPTSGYRWELGDHDPAILQPEDDDYSPPSVDTLGGAGTRQFRLLVIGAGKSRLKLIRRRSWDPDSAVETFETIIDASG
jgi:predicted secreted protein